MSGAGTHRRRVERIRIEPTAAVVNGIAATIVDISVDGIGIEHQGRLNRSNEIMLGFELSGACCVLSCRLMRSRLQRSTLRPHAVVYHSGLQLSNPLEEGRSQLRYVVSAILEERLHPAEADPDSRTPENESTRVEALRRVMQLVALIRARGHR